MASWSFLEVVAGLLAVGGAGFACGLWWNVEGSRVRRLFVHETTLADSNGELYRRRVTARGKPFLLSDGEQRFYVALRKAVGESDDIHFKMRVADLVVPRAGNWRRGYGEAVCRQHVDFVVCKRWTSYPVCCVELDDKTHDREDRRRRDAFLEAAFRSAGLPVVHVPARHPRVAYDVDALREQILEAAGKAEPLQVDGVGEFQRDLEEKRTRLRW